MWFIDCFEKAKTGGWLGSAVIGKEGKERLRARGSVGEN